MNIDKIEPAILATSEGKYVCIEVKYKRNQSHQLVTENLQETENSAKVKVYYISYKGTSKKYMAFCFEVNQESVFPVVTHHKEVNFKVLPTDKPITAGIFDQTFLFQWGERDGNRDWRSLKSVAVPSMYLSTHENGKVIVTSQQMPYFRIHTSKKEREDKQMQSKCRPGTYLRTQCRKTPWQRRDSQQGPSCLKGSVAPTKRLYCPKGKIKKMKCH